MVWTKIVRAGWMLPLLLPQMASALVVEIQGVRLEPNMAGASCVEIAGVFPGLRIEADKPGAIPRICHNAARVNSINIANATLVASTPPNKEVLIKFEHEFPPGVNGKIMARAKLQGFFASPNGLAVPTGDKLQVKTYFAQATSADLIAEPLDFTVGDSMDSALFEYSVKKQYLTVGPRALKGEIKVNFGGVGHKLTLPDRCLVALDSGTRFEDKLDTMESLEGAGLPGAEGGEAAPGGDAAPAPSAGGAAGGSANPKSAGKSAATEGAKPEMPDPPPGVMEKLPPLPNLPPLELLPPKP